MFKCPYKIKDYILVSLLGTGPNAFVYDAILKAPTGEKDEDLVMKVMVQPDDFDLRSKQMIARFDREAQILCSISHPNLVSFVDSGMVESFRYIVMTKASGINLEKLIYQKGRLSWHVAMRIMKQLCAGIGYLHHKKIVHRDIKPSNVMVDEKSNFSTKVIDFGLAFSDDQVSITLTRDKYGTPLYVAPEIMEPTLAPEGSRAPTVDVYALGCIMYEMLIGKPLFDMQDVNMTYVMHVNRGAREVLNRQHDWPADAPAAIDQVLQGAVELRPQNRYPSVQDFLEALQELEKGIVLRPNPTFVDTGGKQEITTNRWSLYTSVANIRKMVFNDDKIYCATDGGILVYDFRQRRGRTLTIQEGLAVNDIRDIKITPPENLAVLTPKGVCVSRDIKSWTTIAMHNADAFDKLAVMGERIFLASARQLVRLDRNGRTSPVVLPNRAETDPIRAIAMDRLGNLWVGTNENLYLVYADNRIAQIDWSGRARINAIRIKDDVVWVATSNGMSRYYYSQWQHDPLSDAFYQNINDCLPITHEKVLLRINNRLFEHVFKQPFRDENTLQIDGVNDFALGSGQEVWLGTSKGLFSLGQGAIRSFETFGLVDNNTNAAYKTSDGTLWFASSSGLAYYDRRWHHVAALKGANVLSLFETSNHVLWIGTENRGLFLINLQPAEELQAIKSNALATYRPIWDLQLVGNDLWAVADGKPVMIGRNLAVPIHEVLCMALDPQGWMWCGCKFGNIIRLRGSQRADLNLGIPAAVQSIAFRRESRGFSVWLVTNNGVYCKGPQDSGFTPAEQAFFKENRQFMTCVYTDRLNRLWFGSKKGIYLINSDGSERKLNTLSDRLPSDHIKHFWQAEDGMMLVATDKGAVSF